MRRRTPQRAREERAYNKRVAVFLDENPVCQFPDCILPSMVVHHSRGRRGWRLLYEPWWRASCWSHNQLAEDETGRALECGWLVKFESAPLAARPDGAA